jgi:outer membrane protein assembly factor BamD
MKKFIRIFVFFALICTIFTSCHKEFNTIQKSKDAKYKLTKADEYFAKKKYSNARVLYEQLFPAYKGQDKFEELYYKYAFCHYYEKMYPEAEQLFKGFLEFFPNSVHAEEVDYMRAYSFYKQSPKLELEQVNTLKAINMMQTFINQHIGSPRVKDANAVIDEGRAKLELKEAREAQLFYNLGQYRASGIAYNNIINSFPETRKGDEYKLMVVKSYYKFAKLSIAEKQLERFEKVVSEYQDFADRYPESTLMKEAESFNNLSKNNIKILTNEQTTPPARL